MNVAENTVNYNERFITKAVREISDQFGFNVIQQRSLSNILYKCTQIVNRGISWNIYQKEIKRLGINFTP